MEIRKLSRLSICECGFPMLNEDIPLGTEYRIEPLIQADATVICGGCGKTNKCRAIFAHGREEGQVGGMLPVSIFLPQN